MMQVGAGMSTGVDGKCAYRAGRMKRQALMGRVGSELGEFAQTSFLSL